ncbi:MAG TPA: acetoin utilization protein AcuC [Steroidobacteraceae bacterium]|nr:acetoin utilization protein AcuC [Steroidobacteraceae bacterium]
MARQMSSVAVVLGERLARYGFPDGHPFGTDRHGAFVREFEARGLDKRVAVLEPRTASDEELRSFHTPAYLEFVRERSESGYGFLDAGDTPAFRGVYEAAACVVGATLNAMETIMQGEARRGFVPIAGLHHASRDRAAGFCVFNDCGVAIELLKRKGLKRVGYIDIDAHHGDGVFYSFEEDAAVIFADLHEDGRYLYPGTGAREETGRGEAVGTKLNVPLPPGADDELFGRVWPHVIAHLEKYAPEFLILQCGADSLEGDPITHLRFSPRVHGRAARELASLADRLGHGRVLALGGGGYKRENLAQAWTAVVENLL